MGTNIKTNNNYRLHLPVKWNVQRALSDVTVPIAQYAGEVISDDSIGSGGCDCENLEQDFDCNCTDC